MAGEKEQQGRELNSFECKASSGSAAMTVLPGTIAIFVAMANFSEGGYIFLLLLIVALIPVLAPIIATIFPRTRSTCTICENGIRIKAIKGSSKARFYPWKKLARFSAKPMGMKGGRISLYPRVAFSIFRREAIEPLKMSDYTLLFNHVSSRVGLY